MDWIVVVIAGLSDRTMFYALSARPTLVITRSALPLRPGDRLIIVASRRMLGREYQDCRFLLLLLGEPFVPDLGIDQVSLGKASQPQ